MSGEGIRLDLHSTTLFLPLLFDYIPILSKHPYIDRFKDLFMSDLKILDPIKRFLIISNATSLIRNFEV